MDTHVKMSERRGRYKQLVDVNNLGGPSFSNTYAEFLQSKGTKVQEDGEDQGRLIPRARASTGEPRRKSKGVTAVVSRTRQSMDDSERRFRVIDDHMWQHRQEERDLKRAENDIRRNQRELKRSLKHYELEVEKRQKDETDWLLGQQSRMVQNTQRDQHEKVRTVKERTESNKLRRTSINECAKEYIKKESELSHKYQKLVETLEKKRGEVEVLSKTFEAKLRSKEDEQHQIKQELADIAIALNMEAQKKKKLDLDVEKEQARSTVRDIREDRGREEALLKEEKTHQLMGAKHEHHKKQLTREMRSKAQEVASKEKRQRRNLVSVQNQLEAAHMNQKMAQRTKESLEAEQMGREIADKMAAVDSQRKSKMSSYQRSLQERNTAMMRTWEENASAQLTEQNRLKHQDRMKQLQKVVSRADQQEHKIYTQVKEAEAERRKQETIIEKLQEDLDALKRENSKKLKEAAIQAQRAEQELENKLLRENGELMKALNQREEGLRELTVLRNRAKEDRRMLNEEKKEYDRRVRIAQHSELLTS